MLFARAFILLALLAPNAHAQSEGSRRVLDRIRASIDLIAAHERAVVPNSVPSDQRRHTVTAGREACNTRYLALSLQILTRGPQASFDEMRIGEKIQRLVAEPATHDRKLDASRPESMAFEAPCDFMAGSDSTGRLVLGLYSHLLAPIKALLQGELDALARKELFPPLDLRAQDKIAFLGDSNTQPGTYIKYIAEHLEAYYPQLRTQMINAGVGGDKSGDALARIERDVFNQGATVLVVVLGVNDILWGGDRSPETRARFLENMRNIIRLASQRRIRVHVLSYPLSNPPAEDITKKANSYLQLMSNDAMSIARSLGQSTIDVQAMMRNWLAERSTRYQTIRNTISDGVHLNDLGNRWVAEAIVRGWAHDRR